MTKRPILSLNRDPDKKEISVKHAPKKRKAYLPPLETKPTFTPRNLDKAGKGNRAHDFWLDADGEDLIENLLGYELESISSDIYLGSKTSSEQVMAHRIAALGPDVAAKFLHYADKLDSLGSIDPKHFWRSENPTEKLAYMGQVGDIDLKRVAALMSHADSKWGGKPVEEGAYEPDYNTQVNQAASKKSYLSRNPTELMLSAVGALTVSDEKWKQQIDEPDIITPDSKDAWIKPLREGYNALRMIASSYIDADKMEGGEFGQPYQTLRKRVTRTLATSLQQNVRDTGHAMANRQAGQALIGWTSAMPSPADIRSKLPASDQLFINDKIDKLWTEYADAETRQANGESPVFSPFTEAIRGLRDLYAKGEEGGIPAARDTKHREAAYLRDELAASGLVDEKQTVLSVGESRDQMYNFKVTTDIGEAVALAMESVGATDADYTHDPAARDQVNAIAKDLVQDPRFQENADNMGKAQNAYKYLTERAENARKRDTPVRYVSGERITKAQASPAPAARSGVQRVASMVAPETPRVELPKQRSSSASAKLQDITGTTRRPTAPTSAPPPAPPVEQKPVTPESSREKYFAARPWLTPIASDDDKHDPMSKWQRERRGKVTSTTAYGLTDPEGKNLATRRLIEGALTPIDQPAEISKGTVFTESGNSLEPLALDWYRENVDKGAFEPGMVTNANMVGQSTTPDAIAFGGKRNVEVKSRDKFLNPMDPDLQPGQKATLRKNYAQTQHQMYLTGAATTDLLEILRDQEDPNAPLGKKGLKEGVNIRRRTIDRDDDFINKHKEEWNRAGRAASQLSALETKDKDELSKAVAEGNIMAFETLTRKHGLTDADAISSILGGDAQFQKNRAKTEKDTEKAERTAEKEREKAANRRYNYGGFGNADAPTTVRGAVRTGMSNLGKLGGIANVALAGAEILWGGAKDVNDAGLDLSAKARSAGMGDLTFAGVRKQLRQARYLDDRTAENDITALSLAKGGLETGHTDRAVNIVESTRGAIDFGDLHDLDPNNAASIKSLIAKAETELEARGVSRFGIAAMMEKSGLQSLLSTAETTEGRKDLNESIASLEQVGLETKLAIATGLGTVATKVEDLGSTYLSPLVDYVEKIWDTLAPQVEEAANAFTDGAQKWAEETRASVKNARDWIKAPSAATLADDLQEFSGQRMGYFSNQRESILADMKEIPYDRRDELSATLRGATASDQMRQAVAAGGKIKVELTTEGVAITVKDDNGVVTSRALKPYARTEYE